MPLARSDATLAGSSAGSVMNIDGGAQGRWNEQTASLDLEETVVEVVDAPIENIEKGLVTKKGQLFLQKL